LEFKGRFRETFRFLIFRVEEEAKQETNEKAWGKESERLAEMSECVGERREMEDSKSVPVGLPVVHNEPPAPIGSQIQLSEPAENKNMVLKKGHFTGL
jgi:hypothetical protein